VPGAGTLRSINGIDPVSENNASVIGMISGKGRGGALISSAGISRSGSGQIMAGARTPAGCRAKPLHVVWPRRRRGRVLVWLGKQREADDGSQASERQRPIVSTLMARAKFWTRESIHIKFVCCILLTRAYEICFSFFVSIFCVSLGDLWRRCRHR